MPSILIQQPEDIQLNDQYEVDQILGNPPSWLLHWGISLVFIAALVFAALAWWIKYPDVIEAKVQIVTENPAIRLVPLTSGKVSELLVENQQTVEKGELLAVIESAVIKKDALQLETLLQGLEVSKKPSAFTVVNLSESLELGMMQNQYARLSQQIKEVQYFLKEDITTQKIATLNQQINHTLTLNDNIKKQQKTLRKEVDLTSKNYQRNKQLNEEGIISDVDLEQLESSYLQYQRQLDNFESQIINNQIQTNQLESQIQDLQQTYKDNRNARILTIRETLQQLKAQLKEWKQTYLLYAPITGKVNLSTIWSANQFATAGEELVTIVPLEGAGKIVAKGLLPIENSGKVKTDLMAHIKLNGYPYQEFGIIKSFVKQIALVPQEEHYQLELILPDTLITTYNKVIPFRQEMEGTVAIITEERRILQRVFDKVWSLIKNT